MTLKGTMSEITPPPPPPAPPPTPAVAPPKAVVANPPEAFARQLALGARLEATITATAQKGHYDIQTPYGRVTLQTTTPLPNDGVLQLQLMSKCGQLQFLITSINGQPPLTALRALGLLPALPAGLPGEALPTGMGWGPAQGPAPSPAQGVLQGPSAAGPAGTAVTRAGQPVPAPLTIGANLTATLLNAATPLAGGPVLTGKSLAAGAQLGTGRVGQTAALPGQAPASGSPAGPSTVAPVQPISTTPQGPRGGGSTTPAPGQTAPSPGPPELLAGTRFTVRITAFQPSPATGVVAPTQAGGGTPAPGSILTGMVTGTATPSGHSVVQTHAGSLAVATRTPLPIGSQVTFEVVSLTQPSTEITGGIKPNDAPSQQTLTRQWPALQDAVRTLGEINPAAAQQLIQAVLPSPGPAMGANILFFMMALSGGNLQNWFGDAPTRALQRTKPKLLARLKDDFGRIDRIARDPGPGEWRSTLIPFHNGVEVNPLRLSLRPAGDEDEDGGQGDKKGSRFIIDLDLTRMGRFQLDGLVYQGEKRMDLIVRTDNRLPDKIEDGIRGIFQEASEVTGLKGGIVFQAAPANFVEISGGETPDELVGLLV